MSNSGGTALRSRISGTMSNSGGTALRSRFAVLRNHEQQEDDPMTTPRQIKASEVRKGMRVRAEAQQGGATVTSEGVVTRKGGEYTALIWFGDHSVTLHPDHPVTVLAEPEPELVVGAWYRCRMRHGDVRHMQRTADNGWATTVDGYTAWVDSDGEVTVLGRVLIIDWPGDDEAREMETNGGNANGIGLGPIKKVCQSVADAIRTQGGAP